MEAAYVRDRTPQAYSSLQEALRDVSLIRTSITKLHLLHQSQRIFAQGERSGRLLAWLSREYSSPVSISRIRSPNGEILTESSHINDQFTAYYQDLYSSRARFTEPELQAYLEGVDLQCLTETTRERLDSPLTLKEIQLAVRFLQSGKTPGPDGYPAEFYKQYAKDLLPMYREMLLKALECGALPPSMSEAVIVVLPKPGKNPELCSSYRPIFAFKCGFKNTCESVGRSPKFSDNSPGPSRPVGVHAGQRDKHKYSQTPNTFGHCTGGQPRGGGVLGRRKSV